MSMSVGASSSNALSYLQQLLQQGKSKSSDASKATDPLSMLMQSLSGGQTSGSQAGDATSTASTASNMLEQLIKLQSQMLNAASSTLSAVA